AGGVWPGRNQVSGGEVWAGRGKAGQPGMGGGEGRGGPRAGRDRERGGARPRRPTVDRELQPRPEGRLARRQGVVDAVPVLDRERLLRRDRELLLPARQQDADRGRGRLAELRAGVVGVEDLLVPVPLLRVALRAPLTHAPPVP